MTHPPEPVAGSTRPYLLRAIYAWAIDHHMTPQVLVDADAEGVVVPADCVKDGRIVLTIHPQSVQALQIGNQHLRFSARFAGAPFAVCIPVTAVAAIYCRENGRGIVFQEADDDNKPKPADSVAPHLRLVK